MIHPRCESTLADRPNERVHDRVGQDVAIRVALEAARVRNVDAAENERASGNQRVQIMADPNTHASDDRLR